MQDFNGDSSISELNIFFLIIMILWSVFLLYKSRSNKIVDIESNIYNLDVNTMVSTLSEHSITLKNELSTEFNESLNSLESKLTKKIQDEVDLISFNEFKDKAKEDKKELSTQHKKSILTINESLLAVNSMVGMKTLKDEINLFVNVLHVNKIREKLGKKSINQSLHSVFLGPPGTGKTSIARILGHIYKSSGILTSGHIVEVSRVDLISQYIGKTAILTNHKIDEAIGGVLFIDEAYSLFSKSDSDYGAEAVNTLIKRMEDDRNSFVVILAGYKKEMAEFLESNTGLKSRFTHVFHFDAYTVDELVSIFKIEFKDQGFFLTPDAEEKLKDIFDSEMKRDTSSFGNGRFARNLFERSIRLQSKRILDISKNRDVTINDIEEITSHDIQLKFQL